MLRLISRLMLMISTLSYGMAYSSEDSTKKDKVAVLYVNGMFNTIETAIQSAAMIQKNTENTPDDGNVIFDTAFKQEESFLLHAFKVYKQVVDSGIRYRHYLSFVNSLEPAGSGDDVGFLNEFTPYFTGSYDYSKDQKFSSSISQYKSYLNSCHKIVAVAHSQGNFYANAAYEYLYDEDSASQDEDLPLTKNSFGIVSVATPARYVAGSSLYTTLFTDKIIEFVRMFFETLDPKTEDTTTGGDWLRHSFINTYMASNSKSKESILSDIQTTIHALEAPLLEPTRTDEYCLDWMAKNDITPDMPDCEMLCATAYAGLRPSITCLPYCGELCTTCGLRKKEDGSQNENNNQ